MVERSFLQLHERLIDKPGVMQHVETMTPTAFRWQLVEGILLPDLPFGGATVIRELSEELR